MCGNLAKLCLFITSLPRNSTRHRCWHSPCIRFLFPVEIVGYQKPPKAPKLMACPNMCGGGIKTTQHTHAITPCNPLSMVCWSSLCGLYQCCHQCSDFHDLHTAYNHPSAQHNDTASSTMHLPKYSAWITCKPQHDDWGRQGISNLTIFKCWDIKTFK